MQVRARVLTSNKSEGKIISKGREIMIKKKRIVAIIAITVVSLMLVAGVVTAIWFGVQNNRYSGHVYEEGTNKPIAGVSVTNGRDVVKTDENGYFELDGWLKDRFVTVTIPSGYWTENYYLDVGKQREGYDFYLTKREGDYTNHTFLQVSDSEVGESGVGSWIDNVRKTVAEEQPAFVIHTGDICYEQGLKNHIYGMNSENTGAPVRYVIGNHDYVKWGDYSEALFESIYGPVCYSFEVGNIHYVVTPLAYGDHMPRYTRSDVWRWLANDLKNTDPGKKVVIFNHDYCPDENGFEVKYGLNKLDLKEHGLLAWVFGHWHYNYMYQTDDGIFNICTGQPQGGGIDSTPASVRLVNMGYDSLIRSELVYYGFDSATVEDDCEWSSALGGRGGFASVVSDSDSVYAATVDDGYPKDCGIYRVDAASGKVIWKFATENSVRNDFVVGDTYVVAQDITGKVYKLSKESGNLIWKTDTGLSAATNTGLSVAVDGDKVYCGGAQKTVCLNLSDGSLVWETKNTHANSAPSRIVVDGDTILVGSHWDELLCYNKYTGKKLWGNDGDDIRNRTTTPSFYKDNICVAARQTVMLIDKQKGKIVRQQTFDEYNFDTATAPLIDGDIGYFATANKGIVAINLSDMSLLWNFQTGESLVFTSPYTSKGVRSVESGIIGKDGKLYFGASDGYAYCIDKNGALVSKINIGSPILSKMAVAGDSFVALDFSGNLTRFDFD